MYKPGEFMVGKDKTAEIKRDKIYEIGDEIKNKENNIKSYLTDKTKLLNKFRATKKHSSRYQLNSEEELNILAKELGESYNSLIKDYRELSKLETRGAKLEESPLTKERRLKRAKEYGNTANQLVTEMVSNLREYGGGFAKADTTERSELEVKLGNETILPALSAVAFSIALISSSFSITGNIISDATNSTANYLALGCFAAGSVLALIYLKQTIKKKKLIKEKLSKKKSTKKKK